jgi:plasmid stability protein
MTESEGPRLTEDELDELEDEVIDTLKEGSARATDRVENEIQEVITNAVESEN